MPDEDPRPPSGVSFSVQVPTTAGRQYLRLGIANAADEGGLPPDPIVEASSGPSAGQSQVTGAATSITSPFGDGSILYSTGTTQFVAPYGYLRLGQPTPFEGYLPTDLGKAAGEAFQPPKGVSDPFPQDGIALYSNKNIYVMTPIFTAVTTDYNVTTTNYNVTTTDNFTSSQLGESWTACYGGMGKADTLVSAQWQAPAVAAVNFQMNIQFNMTLGSSTNIITGNATTFWVGNDASTGAGSLLWSNYGFTQNLFGGQVVNFYNGAIDVQGWGEVKLIDSYELDAAERILLQVTPAASIAATLGNRVLNALKAAPPYLAAAAALISAAGAAADAAGTEIDLVVNETTGRTKAAMRGVMGVSATANSLVLVMQAVAIAAGLTAKRAAGVGSLLPSIKIDTDSIDLSVGPSSILITNSGIMISAPAGIKNIGGVEVSM